jgi:hypothetical protein
MVKLIQMFVVFRRNLANRQLFFVPIFLSYFVYVFITKRSYIYFFENFKIEPVPYFMFGAKIVRSGTVHFLNSTLALPYMCFTVISYRNY